MSDPIWLALIAAVPASLAGWAAVNTSRTHSEVKTIRLELNGRLSELLKATNAQGRQDERDAQKEVGK
jgi:hypothetical protein